MGWPVQSLVEWPVQSLDGWFSRWLNGWFNHWLAGSVIGWLVNKLHQLMPALVPGYSWLATGQLAGWSSRLGPKLQGIVYSVV